MPVLSIACYAFLNHAFQVSFMFCLPIPGLLHVFVSQYNLLQEGAKKRKNQFHWKVEHKAQQSVHQEKFRNSVLE